MRKEPLNSTKFPEHPEVVALITRENQMPFFDKFHGYDEEVTKEFLLSLRPHSKNHATVTFKGLTIELTLECISRITCLPLGLPWIKEEKPLRQVAKKTFLQPDKHLVEDKNGIRRTSITYTWGEVSYEIMKYISCEGRYNIIYGYHFKVLHELRYGMDLPTSRKLSLPYFLLQSLGECSTKLNAGILDQLAHHGLIKFLVEDAFHTYTIPIVWEIFKNMTKEDDIKNLTDGLSPSGIEEEEQKEESKREIHEEAQNIRLEEEKQRREEEHDSTTDEPKAEKKKVEKVEKGKTTTEKRKRTKTKKKKPKTTQKKAATRKA